MLCNRRRFPLLVLALLVGVAGILLPCLGVSADDDEAPAGRKYALLVGVRNYNKDELRNLDYTENDINDLAEVLRETGYKRVVVLTQSEAADLRDNDLLPTRNNIREQLRSLLEDRKTEDSVLVAFSGHGVQPHGEKGSYFCPMDARVRDRTTLVPLAEVYAELEQSKAGVKVLLADCCRNDPAAGGDKGVPKLDLESVTRPPAEAPPGGVAALFSCSEGEQAYESAKFQHGVFFHFVIEGLKGEAANKRGDVTLQGLAAYVTDEAPDQAKEEWGPRARQHPELVGKLSASGPLAQVLRDEIVASNGMKLKLIKPGKFLMGSPKDEAGRDECEGPQQEVEIARPFYVGVYPVTQEEYEHLMGNNPSSFCKGGKGKDKVAGLNTERFPVENVTWDSAVDFCEALTKADAKKPTGWEYGLPTEAEWEYVCRAGTTTALSFGDDPKGLDDYGWCNATSDMRTHEVGTKKPNPWGLYDMHGNVWQWCADHFRVYGEKPAKDAPNDDDDDRYMLRGGSWGLEAEGCRSASRSSGDIFDNGEGDIGFRVVLRPAAKAQ